MQHRRSWSLQRGNQPCFLSPLRTLRLLFVYRASGEANALRMLVVNTIFYALGFAGAVAGDMPRLAADGDRGGRRCL